MFRLQNPGAGDTRQAPVARAHHTDESTFGFNTRAWRLLFCLLTLALSGFTSACKNPLPLFRPETPEPLENPEPQPPLERFEFTRPQMGVPFRIVLYGPDEATATLAAEAAFARVEELNAILSDYETDSELNELSRTAGEGRSVSLSPDLWAVLHRAQDLARLTGGAFDVTVAPAANLWRRARRLNAMPDPERLARARGLVGHEKLYLNPRQRTARLFLPGMSLDLGGIAKGYAIDEALLILRQHGLPRALVAAGGDTVVGDPPPGRDSWRVEVTALDVPNAPPVQFLTLANAAVATSGDLFQRLEIDGKRYSHIVDPRTGIGLTDRSLVTVVAPDGITADSLATAVSVLGPEEGLQLIKNTPGTAAYIVRQPRDEIEVIASENWPGNPD
ncbi:MAG TPA: FAD:protein FMN transferase [Methylomirabilota bacterium]|nr:FAD:protein FMN transferase [Methylomirabilota bacterium]